MSDAITFNVIHNDGLIRVRIDSGVAVFSVDLIQDIGVVVLALKRAREAGATRGTWFTGEVVNDDLAEKFLYRAESGITWLGGDVTQLDDGFDGPQFRIDWDWMPSITE